MAEKGVRGKESDGSGTKGIGTLFARSVCMDVMPHAGDGVRHRLNGGFGKATMDNDEVHSPCDGVVGGKTGGSGIGVVRGVSDRR